MHRIASTLALSALAIAATLSSATAQSLGNAAQTTVPSGTFNSLPTATPIDNESVTTGNRGRNAGGDHASEGGGIGHGGQVRIASACPVGYIEFVTYEQDEAGHLVPGTFERGCELYQP